jgi:hypothetical protein
MRLRLPPAVARDGAFLRQDRPRFLQPVIRLARGLQEQQPCGVARGAGGRKFESSRSDQIQGVSSAQPERRVTFADAPNSAPSSNAEAAHSLSSRSGPEVGAHRICAMAWATPQYTRSHVGKAGRILIGDDEAPTDDISDPTFHEWMRRYEQTLAVINNWRSSHSFPLNTFQVGLRRKARQVSSGPLGRCCSASNRIVGYDRHGAVRRVPPRP